MQQSYIQAIQQRIQSKVSRDFPALQKKWILDYLMANDWSIRVKEGPKIAQKLGLRIEHVYHYKRVDCWLPDVQWGPEFLPCCPNCKTNNRVGAHGFQSKSGRIIVDLKEIITLLLGDTFATLARSAKLY